MKYIGNKNAINYIKGLPKRVKQPWKSIFPNVIEIIFNIVKSSDLILDLISKMITFDPEKRWTVE